LAGRTAGGVGGAGTGSRIAAGGSTGSSFSSRHSTGFSRNSVNNVNNFNNFNNFGGGFGSGFGFGGFGFPFGYGFGGGLLYSLLYGLGGYGGYGYGGYGGYGLYGGYGGYGSYGGYGGYGGGYGYDAYGTGQYAGYGSGYYDPNAYASAAPPVTAGQPQYAATGGGAANAGTFADNGEGAFRAGDYKGAIYFWRHALVDDTKNPVVAMMLGQALFATGQYDEAAGVTQVAMQMIPKEQWGVVVTNYKELYGNPQDYSQQLRALEKAVGEKPNDPAMRFLAGFQYAYLGFPQQAVDQLDKGLKANPKDEMAKLLRNEMLAKLGKPAAPAARPTPEAPTTSNRTQAARNLAVAPGY
jgi:hypothetical protein